VIAILSKSCPTLIGRPGTPVAVVIGVTVPGTPGGSDRT